jgi:peroxiredoxin
MTDQHNQEGSLPAASAHVTGKNVATVCGLVLVTAGLIYFGIREYRQLRTHSSFIPATSRGHHAPNFALSTMDGKILHLSDYRGKAVLINFFGNTCEPCLEESPWLVEIQKQDKAKGLEIIGIEMYGASNDEIKSYAKQFGTNYTLVPGNAAVGNEYGIGSFPTSYYVNAKGTIVSATVGLHSKDEIESNVQAVLNSQL